jgi:hypothetical protein
MYNAFTEREATFGQDFRDGGRLTGARYDFPDRQTVRVEVQKKNA